MTKRLEFDRLIDALEKILKLPAPSNHGCVGEGGAFQSNDWRGTTFHASILYPAIMSRAAAMPLLQAHWKL